MEASPTQVSYIKSNLLKRLFKGTKLSIYSDSFTAKDKLSLKEKILSSSPFKNFYFKEYADLNYFMSIQPYLSGSQCFGQIGMIEPVEDGSIAIRGWLFSPNFRIIELSLIVNEQKYPVYAFNLFRLDVSQNFYFLNNSKNCGFVCLLESQTHEITAANIKFEVRSSNGQVHVGGF